MIAIHDADRTSFPNLALMKLSSYHKTKGEVVEFFRPICRSAYSTVYSSKVFSFTKENLFLPKSTYKGGSGYNLEAVLSDEIEHIMPDYDIYEVKQSYGFLTRGCIRKCKHCIVPEKEGNIKPHADIEEFLNHKECILMDNNVLACDHGIEQIEKIARLGIKVDFNQGLDARLIDDGIARRLAKVKWLHPVRLACDSQSQMESLHKAVELLRWHNVRPTRYFVYTLIEDIEEAMERIKFVKGLYCEPFAQPLRDPKNNKKPTQKQKDFSRWINHTAIFNKIPWERYNPKFKNISKKHQGFRLEE